MAERTENRTFTTASGQRITVPYRFNHGGLGATPQVGVTNEDDNRADRISGSSLDEVIVPIPPQGQWTTVSDIAEALLRRSGRPVTQEALNGLIDQIILENNLKDSRGRDCTGARRNFALIWPEQVLEIPDGLDNHGPLNVRFRAAENCPPLIDDPEAPAVREIMRTVVIEQEIPQRVALPVYVTGGNLRDGQTADIQDAYNLPILFGHMPDQPDPAARGLGGEGTGMQTVYGTASRIIGDVLLYSPQSIPIGGGALTIGLIPVTYSGHSGDRERDARQGSNATQQDIPGTAWRFDFPWISENTRLDGTFLPGLGVDVRDGRIVDDPNSPHNNNQVYYGALGTAAYEPGMTLSDREVSSGYTERNQRLQERPTDAMSLAGLNNYSLAFYANQERIQPQITMGYNLMVQQPTNPAVYQQQINLLRFQQQLVGVSNFDITSPREIARLAALDPNALSTADQTALSRLNPREMMEYQIQYTTRLAETNGVTGLNVAGEALTGDRYPIRSVTQSEMREQMVEYYTRLATEEPDIFRDMVQRETGTRPRYNARDAGAVGTVVGTFVDNHTIVREYPIEGFSLEHMDRYFRLPEERFNPVERFQSVGGEFTGAENRSAVLSGAMATLADDPEITRMLLAASDDLQVAQAWSHFDNSTVQRPAQYGMGGWDRGDEMVRLRDRGYGEEAMTGTFSREETQGIIRGLGSAEAPGPVVTDLIASAQSPDIIARRQADLRLMATAGTRDGRGGILAGGHAEHLLYALAQERDNTTLLAIEARIRETDPENADRRIADLRAGVAYARNNVMGTMLGTGHDQLAGTIAATEITRDGPSARVETQTRDGVEYLATPDAEIVAAAGTGTLTRETDETVRTVSEGNIRTVFTHLGTATGAPGAQRFLEASVAQAGREGGDPETVRALLTTTSTTASAADQLILARRIVSTPGALTAFNTMIQASDAPENVKTNVAAMVADPAAAARALNGASAAELIESIATRTEGHPETLTPIVQAIAGDPRASRVVVGSIAGAPAVADAIIQRLDDTEKAEIATRSQIRLSPGQTPVTVWNALATEVGTEETITIERRVVPTAGAIRDFRDASDIEDPQARAVASVNAHLRSPITRTNALEAIASTPDGMLATVPVITNMFEAHPEMMQGVIDNLNDAGDRTRPGFWHTIGRWNNDHAHGRLARILEGLQDARESGNAAQIANFQGQLGTFLQSTTTNAENALAVQDLIAVTMTAPNGQVNLAAAWTAQLASMESNATLQGNMAALMVNSIVAHDPTHAGLLSNSTTWAQENSYTVPGGFFLPFYAWFTDGNRARPADGVPDPGKPDVVTPGGPGPVDPTLPGPGPGPGPGVVPVGPGGGTLPVTPIPPVLPPGVLPGGGFTIAGTGAPSGMHPEAGLFAMVLAGSHDGGESGQLPSPPPAGARPPRERE